MRNIYGNRSIIPNNYYFTFDKIYENLTDIANNHGDTVLIGRTVLCQQDHTVWLKTVNGYIRVAKLDNEGRFKFLEGYPLTNIHNINDLTGLGDSPNGNGTYLVNYDKGVQGTYPSIRGIKDTEDGKSIYLPNTTFLLNQYSQNKEQENSFVNIMEYYYGEVPPDGYKDSQYKNLFFLHNRNYYKIEKGSFVRLEWTQQEFDSWKTNTDSNKIEVYIEVPKTAIVQVFQIMTDISSGITDKPDDDYNNRKDLYHNNKTFTRQCSYKYTAAIDWVYFKDENGDYYFKDNKYELIGDTVLEESTQRYSKQQKYYKYDFFEDGYQEVINPSTFQGYYTRELSTNWSNWDDLSEQYIGYIGDLDPLLIEGEEKSNNNNLSESSNLVEALNTHDKIIGANSRINKNGIVKNIEYGALSNNLSNDNRSYNIPEDNIMDAIVHHDADIGQIENLKAGTLDKNTNNLQFTKDNSQIEGDITKIGNIQSLTQAIQLLDKIVGAYRRFNDNTVNTNDTSLIHTITEDSRSTSLSGKNIIDALLYHDADIGELSRLTNINNIAFTKDKITNLNTDVSDNPSNINSLIDAILVLNALIGNGQLLSSNTLQATEGNKYKIEAKNIIDALVEHDMNIGELTAIANDNNSIPQTSLVEAINRLNALIGVLNNFNGTNTTTNIEWIDDKDALTSLVDVIITLDNLIGDFNDSVMGKKQIDENGKIQTTGVEATTIVGAIGEHDKEIGELEDLQTTEKDSLVEAINEHEGRLNNYQQKIESLEYQTTENAGNINLMASNIVDLQSGQVTLNNNLNNLAENINYMDSTIADLANQINAGGTTSGFNWGSF